FFIVMTLIYGFWSEFEPVGTTALALLVGLTGMPELYFMKLSGEVDESPEDVVLAEVEDYAGDYQRFSPLSWLRMLLGVSATLLFLVPALRQWSLLPFDV